MLNGTLQISSTNARVALLAIVCCAVLSGCQRQWYRQQADCDANQLVASRTEAIFFLPDRTVEPAGHSRLADLSDPDCGPLPPDDPAASRYMHHPYRSQGSKVWRERGELPSVEFAHWQASLPTDEEGVVHLNRNAAMELALLHSREYQTEVEGVYLRALPVSLERFRFDTQWSGGSGLNYVNDGLGTTNSTNTLALGNSFLGFQKQFASGGQLLADLSNTMVWEFNGRSTSALSTLSFRFLQPLMRRAFRSVQLEPLTQAERNLLYSVRDFARFRQTFYIDTVGTDGYLGLLAVAQAIRNEQSNLDSLQRNLDEHEALYDAGLVSQFQIDQVYQDYEQGRLSVLQAQASYNTALDRFKLQLGLPSTLAAVLDSEELQQFELNDPALEQLTSDSEITRIGLLQYSENELPTSEELTDFLNESKRVAGELPYFINEVKQEIVDWKTRIAEKAQAPTSEHAAQDDRREAELADRLLEITGEIEADLSVDQQTLTDAKQAIDSGDSLAAWNLLNELCGEHIRGQLADLFVIQTQVRVYLIQVTPLQVTEPVALALVRDHRLDLKNEQGRVVDAYRQTEVAADLLEADLDLILTADIGTDAGQSNPVRFDASASSLGAGLQFDGPLNRMAERNVYRSSQIGYQQARRNYMATLDRVDFEVRNGIRNLNLNRFQFEISRQQLITAARQVEQAQFNLRSSTEPDSNLTRDLLTALQSLLRSRNNLIGSWVQYETSRMELYRTLGMLYVDDTGTWINDGQSFINMMGDINDNSNDIIDNSTSQSI